jgi:hypothetical protein
LDWLAGPAILDFRFWILDWLAGPAILDFRFWILDWLAGLAILDLACSSWDFNPKSKI